MFKGSKTYYKKTEKLALAIVVTARKIMSYFHGHMILMKTNYLMRQVYKKTNLEGRLLSWVL